MWLLGIDIIVEPCTLLSICIQYVKKYWKCVVKVVVIFADTF